MLYSQCSISVSLLPPAYCLLWDVCFLAFLNRQFISSTLFSIILENLVPFQSPEQHSNQRDVCQEYCNI